MTVGVHHNAGAVDEAVSLLLVKLPFCSPREAEPEETVELPSSVVELAVMFGEAKWIRAGSKQVILTVSTDRCVVSGAVLQR